MTDVRAALEAIVAEYDLHVRCRADYEDDRCSLPNDMGPLINRARAALAAASPEPEERIDRWGDKGPCGFVHPGGTPCLIERYKHPNVVAIGHRWKPTRAASPEPERCACGDPREAPFHTDGLVEGEDALTWT